MYNIPNIRIVILWPKTQEFWDETIAALENNLTILQQYEIQWTPERVQSNYSRFFERRLTTAEIDSQYGRGSFRLCVVELSNVQTSGDVTEFFQKKGLGCDGVYISLSAEKANRDLTLLLGKNISDWCCEHREETESIIRLTKDLEGANQWRDLSHLFYVMNSTLDYCVLRNFETLPDKHDPSIHGDIDLLVANKMQAAYVMNATNVFPEEYRVYHMVRFENGKIPFDLRYVGDGYYDEKWENDVLRAAKKYTPPYSQFRVTSSMHLYFTLLYHAYIQKRNVAEDYPIKLQAFAEKIGAVYKNDASYAVKQLEEFMEEYGYKFVQANDKTVFFNWSNLKYAKSYGILYKEDLVDKIKNPKQIIKRFGNRLIKCLKRIF